MKKLSFIFLICLIVFSVFAFSVLADGGISKTVYSDSDIYFGGQRVEFNARPVLVVEQDENAAKTYVPVREFFEKLGYDVLWRGDRSIHINEPDISSTEKPESTEAPLG